jgi:sugar phosphate permease
VKEKVGRVRWGISILLSLGIVVNYFDRINISIATKPLMREFGLNLGQMGIILSAFIWAYTIAQIPAGAVLDRVGVKWLNRACTLAWTGFTALTAIFSGMSLFILCRFMLGLAEAPSFPAASKATGYWFPIKERGVATSVWDMSAKLSSVIGIPLIAWAMTVWGWRGGFWLTVVLSLIYAIAWWAFYCDPLEHKKLSKEEYSYIVEGGAQKPGQASGGIARNLGFLLRQRKVWGATLGFGLNGYAYWLLLTWMPGFLQTQLNMSLLSTGIYAMIPWIVATLSNLYIGGWAVDKFIRKGYDPSKVRKSFIVANMLLGLTICFTAVTNNPKLAVFWMATSICGLSAVTAISWSLPSIIAPRGTAGTVGGIMNFANGLAGSVSTIVTGYIAQKTGSFFGAFALAACVVFCGIFFFTVVLDRIEEIKTEMPTAEIAAVHR